MEGGPLCTFGCLKSSIIGRAIGVGMGGSRRQPVNTVLKPKLFFQCKFSELGSSLQGIECSWRAGNSLKTHIQFTMEVLYTVSGVQPSRLVTRTKEC
jgi:phage terminase large subunit-like protein